MRVIMLLFMLLLAGCSLLPGRIVFETEQPCGYAQLCKTTYTSTKDVDVHVTMPDGREVSLMSSATQPLNAFGEAANRNAEAVNELLQKLPPLVVP